MTEDGMPAFKVLIAGGGVAGLTLANALERAGIDYLLLEKRDIAPGTGASISLLCHTARVFDQLGIWGVMRDRTIGLTGRQHFDETGRLFEDSKLFELIIGITKRPFIFMERRFYLQCLYDNLENKSKVRPRCGVRGFREEDNGVVVTTDGGEEIKGSILIGVDGVHSTIRELMLETLAKKQPNLARGMSRDFIATYKTLFVTSHNHFVNDPSRLFLSEGMVHNAYYRRCSGVSAAGAPGLVFWFLFVKLDRPLTLPECPRYTDTDIEATLETYGHLSLGAGYTFNDLWASRVGGGMVPMEEGVLKAPWHNKGRVLLMGDSVAKSTVNVGLGGNTAVEGVVTFVNELVPLLERSQEPRAEDIASLFDTFEHKFRPRARLCVNLSHYVTRFEAMDTWWLRLLRWLSPWFPDSSKAKMFLDFMAPAPVLNFLPNPDAKKS